MTNAELTELESSIKLPPGMKEGKILALVYRLGHGRADMRDDADAMHKVVEKRFPGTSKQVIYAARTQLGFRKPGHAQPPNTKSAAPKKPLKANGKPYKRGPYKGSKAAKQAAANGHANGHTEPPSVADSLSEAYRKLVLRIGLDAARAQLDTIEKG